MQLQIDVNNWDIKGTSNPVKYLTQTRTKNFGQVLSYFNYFITRDVKQGTSPQFGGEIADFQITTDQGKVPMVGILRKDILFLPNNVFKLISTDDHIQLVPLWKRGSDTVNGANQKFIHMYNQLYPNDHSISLKTMYLQSLSKRTMPAMDD